jgi:hypothetical protein
VEDDRYDRKSPRLNVVVSPETGDVELTDETDPESPVLHFSKEEWNAFMAGVRAGEFDVE